MRRTIGIVVLALGGCAGDAHFLKSADLSNASLVTDAKQRAIVTFPAAPERSANPGVPSPGRRIVCAEPSPDVAQAISTALQAGLTADLGRTLSGATANKTLGLDFGQSSAASIAQLGERLAVVQLLRDKMYRACEAYANGAIGEAAYTLLLARNDKSMMSLLSNELAASAFGRQLATAGSQAAIGGVDARALAEQQTAVKAAATQLQTAAGAATVDKDAVAAASRRLDEELLKLVTLERRTSLSATATAQPAGPAASGPGATPRDSAQIAAIHQNFIDDDGVDPLVDACIIGVERLSKEDERAREYVQGIVGAKQQARRDVQSLNEQIAKAQGALAESSARFEPLESRAKLIRTDMDRAEFAANLLRQRIEAGANQDQSLKNERSELVDRLNFLRIQEAEVVQKLADLKGEQAGLEVKIQNLAASRANAESVRELQAADLYLASGSPFAAFCFKTVLDGDSEFVRQRMQQKRRLRGLEASDESLRAKTLDICAQTLRADPASIDAGVRNQILRSCAVQIEAQGTGKPAAAAAPANSPRR